MIDRTESYVIVKIGYVAMEKLNMIGLTPHAQMALRIAKRQAGNLGDDVKAEHLLLGILALPQSLVSGSFIRAGVNFRYVLERIKSVREPQGHKDSPNLTREIENVITEARKIANQNQHDYIGVDHLLLGVLREPSGTATSILLALGVPSKNIEEEVLECLVEDEACIRKSQDTVLLETIQRRLDEEVSFTDDVGNTAKIPFSKLAGVGITVAGVKFVTSPEIAVCLLVANTRDPDEDLLKLTQALALVAKM